MDVPAVYDQNDVEAYFGELNPAEVLEELSVNEAHNKMIDEFTRVHRTSPSYRDRAVIRKILEDAKREGR